MTVPRDLARIITFIKKNKVLVTRAWVKLWPEQSHIEARCWLNYWGALRVGFRAMSARDVELKGSRFGVRVFGVSSFRVEVSRVWSNLGLNLVLAKVHRTIEL